MTASNLLRTLCAAGVAVRIEGGRVRLVAGKGTLPPDLRLALTIVESGFLSLLRTGSWMLQAPLSTFATLTLAIEFHVPGLSGTLWFASDTGQVDRLVNQGIRRGRIWDADELARLWAAGPPSHDEILSIAKGKLWSNGVLTGMEMRPVPQRTTLEAEPRQATLNLGASRMPEVD